MNRQRGLLYLFTVMKHCPEWLLKFFALEAAKLELLWKISPLGESPFNALSLSLSVSLLPSLCLFSLSLSLSISFSVFFKVHIENYVTLKSILVYQFGLPAFQTPVAEINILEMFFLTSTYHVQSLYGFDMHGHDHDY